MAPALEVRDLWKAYAAGVRGCSARVWVLRGASLVMTDGERVGVVGARGAGKTTLVDCLRGLRRPDAGWVTHAERSPHRVRLLDEPELDDDDPLDGALLFARDAALLRDRVDRLLLLRDGRLGVLDVPRARRVAEVSDPRRAEPPSPSLPAALR